MIARIVFDSSDLEVNRNNQIAIVMVEKTGGSESFYNEDGSSVTIKSYTENETYGTPVAPQPFALAFVLCVLLEIDSIITYR